MTGTLQSIVAPGHQTQNMVAYKLRLAFNAALQGLAFTTVFLIEVCVSESSTFAAAVVEQGGAALRIVCPAAGDKSIQQAPQVVGQEVVNWALDLMVPAARIWRASPTFPVPCVTSTVIFQTQVDVSS